MSIGARLRRLEARQPAPVPTPVTLNDEERAQRFAALMARVIDPDTRDINPNANPRLLAGWRRIEELFAAAEARRDAAQGTGQGR